MSEVNSKTIIAYDTHVQEYIENTSHKVTDLGEAWLCAIMANLSQDARILEIGTGIGHDALFMEERGYKVERTDATPGFVEHLRKQGHDAKLLNVLTDKITGSYDLILADGVMYHFTPQDIRIVMKNIREGLSPGGKFAFSIRLGERDGWSTEKLGVPRYFRYWTRGDIDEVLESCGFVKIVATDGHLVNSSWLHVIATKS